MQKGVFFNIVGVTKCVSKTTVSDDGLYSPSCRSGVVDMA